MSYFRYLFLLAWLVLTMCGCDSQFHKSKSYLVDTNLNTGRFSAKGYHGSTSAILESHEYTLMLEVNILLDSGELAVEVISPDGEIFKSLVASAGKRTIISEKLPSILGEWRVTAKCEYARGRVNIGLKIPEN